jgi:hypothetical protein
MLQELEDLIRVQPPPRERCHPEREDRSERGDPPLP